MLSLTSKHGFLLNTFLTFALILILVCGASPVNATEPVPPPDEFGPYSIGLYKTSFYQHPYGTYEAVIRYPAEYNGWRAPKEPSDKPYPGIAVSSGYACFGIIGLYTINWVSEYLTSHGYVTITISTPCAFSIDITQWAYGFNGGISKLKRENRSCFSPIHEMVDTEKFGIIGLSMGGGGVLEATGINPEIDAAVALAPAASDIPGSGFVFKDVEEACKNITVPTQIQIGSDDCIVPPHTAYDYYTLIPETTIKEHIEINSGTHVGYITGLHEEQHRISRKYFISWFNYFLKDQNGYEPYIFGSEAQNDYDNGVLTQWRYNIP